MFQGRLLSLSNPSSGGVAPCSNRRLAGSLLLTLLGRQGRSATYGRADRVVGRSYTVGTEAVLSAHTSRAGRLPPGRPVPSSSCVTPACLMLGIGLFFAPTEQFGWTQAQFAPDLRVIQTSGGRFGIEKL